MSTITFTMADSRVTEDPELGWYDREMNYTLFTSDNSFLCGDCNHHVLIQASCAICTMSETQRQSWCRQHEKMIQDYRFNMSLARDRAKAASAPTTGVAATKPSADRVRALLAADMAS